MGMVEKGSFWLATLLLRDSHREGWLVMPKLTLRPNLYRRVCVVMSDGSTFTSFSAVRQVGDILALERDTANHPIYLAQGDGSTLLDAREAARLEKVLERERRRKVGAAAPSVSPR